MSRYIDADKYLAKAQYEAQAMPDNFGFAEYTEWLLDKTPSIDIVRCAECMWRDKDTQGEYYCMYVKGMADINDDSFCSWGERESE